MTDTLPPAETLGPDGAPEARAGRAGARISRTDRDGAILVDTDGSEVRLARWASRATETWQLHSVKHYP